MYVVRDGDVYLAAATITYEPEDEGSFEWMAAAIAVLDISVDIAQAEEDGSVATD